MTRLERLSLAFAKITSKLNLLYSQTNTFESVSKNLKAYPFVLNFVGEQLSSTVYTTASGTITKTFNYTGETLTSIVLSGDTPDGVSLTKTLNYTGETLTSVSYS